MQTYIHLPILRCKMLVGKSQALELHPTDAGCAFYKTLFQHTAGMRSHHGIVMIITLHQREHIKPILEVKRVKQNE